MCKKIGRQWRVVVVLFVICFVFCGNVFGNNTIDQKNPVELKRANEIHIVTAAAVTETNDDIQSAAAINDGESVTIEDGEEDEPSFIVKLGTFLLISSVLIFALQWHQKKRTDKGRKNGTA